MKCLLVAKKEYGCLKLIQCWSEHFGELAICQCCKMSMMQNDNDAKCQLYIYVNVAKCQCFSVSAIYQTIFDLRKGIEQALQVLHFFSFFRAFIASNVDICRSDSWYCLDNSFHDYDHFILCQNASLLLSIGFFKQTQTVRY